MFLYVSVYSTDLSLVGFLLMIGMAIYVDKIHNSNLGAGFAMNILGWLSAWATGGLLLFLAIRGGGEAATT